MSDLQESLLNSFEILAKNYVQQAPGTIVIEAIVHQVVNAGTGQYMNASKNSCHQYGTTVDITYVRFDKPEEHRANDPKLLQLLMQTVYDMHRSGRCYVKYERKQSCLHITVR